MSDPHVLVCPADLGGCGHYRLIWPGEHLNSQGLPVDVLRPAEDESNRAPFKVIMQDLADGSHVVGLETAPDCDVIVLQRPLRRERAELIPHLQKRGIAVVVEVDDNFRQMHRNNAAWRHVQPRLSETYNWKHLDAACAAADLVTVSTPALAQVYGRHGRVEVIPNYVPASYLNVARPPALADRDDTTPYLGWSGSVASHPTDLAVIAGVVPQLLAENGWGFAVVGTGKGVDVALHLDSVRASGWMEIHAYPEAIAQFDLGIVPLDRSPFNEAKSWLKGLEMAAVGVPFVASATGPYRELAKAGIGFPADRPLDWIKALRNLMRMTEYRESFVDAWRTRIAADYTIEGNSWRWAQAWKKAFDHRIDRTLVRSTNR